MNINEDKFANKSAEEIISDMLTQHKNNSKEALDHIQDILKDDGLTLSKDIKANLEKAATMLSDKGLKEGWFSKLKPKYAVKFEVYLPFRREPAQFQIPPVENLNDPLVKETLAKIRERHPKSTIYIRSELGDKRITEEKSNDTSDKPKKAKKFKTMMGNILSSDLVKNLAATTLGAATGISPLLIQPTSNGVLSATANKFENVNKEYQVNLYTENNKYTCYVGNLGIALALVENASQYNKADVLKENNIVCSYDRSLKEWSINKKENELKEDLNSFDDLTTHSYADLRKDIANIDERLVLIDCGLNPNLIDKRRPKWSNIFGRREYATAIDSETGEEVHNLEVLVTLHGIEPNINLNNPDDTEVTLIKKIPYRVTDRGTTYKDGGIFVVSVGQFKQLLQDPENAQTLNDFEKSKGSAILSEEEKEEFRSLDEWAKKAIDSEYPEWEAEHAKEYSLYGYTLPERAKIYQEYKDLNRTNMYQQARELTADEVDMKYGLPKLKKIFGSKKEYSKYLTAFESIRKAISPKDQTRLDKSLLKVLDTEGDDIATTQRKISKLIGYFGAKTQLNQIPAFKNELAKLEKDILPEKKAEFDKELLRLISNKYVDIQTGLPTILKKPKEALADVNNLINKYKGDTKTSEFSRLSTNTKEVVDVVKQIKDVFNQIDQKNPELVKHLKDTFVGLENNWKNQRVTGDELVTNLNEFLMYCQDVANKNNEVYSTDDATIKAWIDQNSEGGTRMLTADDYYAANRMKELPDSEKETQHNNWMYAMKHIENPKSKSTDRTYYTAITNKISRLIKTDPQAANGYHKHFEKVLKDLEAKYPEGDSPEVEAALANFLKTFKDETKMPGTVSGALGTGLARKLKKLDLA